MFQKEGPNSKKKEMQLMNHVLERKDSLPLGYKTRVILKPILPCHTCRDHALGTIQIPCCTPPQL